MTRNTRVWLHGLLAAFIGGGASAVTSAFTTAMFAPDRFNLSGGAPLIRMLSLMAVTFAINGALMAFAYLRASPLPNGDWDGEDRRSGLTMAASAGANGGVNADADTKSDGTP